MSDTPIPPIPEQPQNEAEPESVTETPTIEDRLKAIGEGGEALLAILDRLLETIEQIDKPELLAGSIGFIFQGKSIGLKSEFGCIASEFGNDLILKGLSATMAENRSEQKKTRMRQNPGLDLTALLNALKNPTASPIQVEIRGTAEDLGGCDDPDCPNCNAVRALLRDEKASGPVAPPSPEAEG